MIFRHSISSIDARRRRQFRARRSTPLENIVEHGFHGLPRSLFYTSWSSSIASGSDSDAMRLILSIPLFLYLLIAANLVMLGGTASGSLLNVVLLDLPLPSGRDMIVTVSDAFIIAGVLSLYVETLKATRTSIVSIVDHGLSLLVFVAFLIEIMLVPEVGNTTFLILGVCSLMDVVMGFTVTISTARRDLAVGL